MRHSISCFDQFGRFVMPDPAICADLSDQDRARLNHLAACAAANAEAEARVEELRRAVVAATDALALARAEYRKAHPPITHTQLAKEWIACQRAENER